MIAQTETSNTTEAGVPTGRIMTNTESLKPGGIPAPRSKVAIVGFAATSMREVTPLFDDPDFEIWGLNQLYMAFPEIVQHATRWFQIHDRKHYDAAIRDHKHSAWMGVQKTFPIYMQEINPDIPMSVKFPIQSMLKQFGEYFTNSISWELALAIYEGFKEIHVYGVDMAQDDEYTEQRPSVEYFLGWAQGRGIRVHVPENSDLLKAFWLYPFENDIGFEGKITTRIQELRQRAGQFAAQEQGLHDQRMMMLGAIDNMAYVRRNWRGSVREMRLDGNRPRFNIVTGSIIDENKQAEEEAALRQPPPEG